MGIGIGSTYVVIRVFIIILTEGSYIANEPNMSILLSEIVFLTTGFILYIYIFIKVSIKLIDVMM